MLTNLMSRLKVVTSVRPGVNKARKWGKPDVNGVVEHVRDVAS